MRSRLQGTRAGMLACCGEGSAWGACGAGGFERLEERSFLSVSVSNFTATPALVLAGAPITLAADAFSLEGVRAVTFFRDVDNNGSWTPGVDEAIGDVFQRDPFTLKYQKTLAAPLAWGRNAHILADAVDVNGNWTTGPLQSVTVTVNRAPQVTSFTASGSTFNTGQSVTFTARASDDAGVRAMTFFIDRDNNGRFTQGLDSPLGTDFNVDSFGNYTLTSITDSTWPLNAHILADAQDFDGQWSGAPGGLTLHVGNPTPPTITNFLVTTGRGSTSPTITLRANVTDNLGVRAVTFFQDFDGNNRWTPGVDLSLGTLFNSDVGSPGQYTLTVATDFAGDQVGHFVCDAADVDNTWATTQLTADASPERYQFIQVFTVEMLGAALARVSATAWIPPYFNQAFGSVDHVLFAQDINGNDRFDSGDLDLGIETTRTADGNYFYFEKFAGVDGTQQTPLKFLAAVPLTSNNVWTDPTGPIRTASGRDHGNIPSITAISIQAGLNPSNNQQTFVNPGTKFSFTVDATANAGIDAISFFFDRNMNGRWDPTMDIDLGFTRPVGGPITGTFTYSGIIPAGATGFGAFTAVVHDLSMVGRDEWGSPRALQVTPVYAVPKMSLATAAPTAHGNPLVIDFTATDDFGVRATSAFLDSNHNNGLDGSDKVATSFSLISGTPANGRWRLTIDTTALAAGNYTVFISGLDFYRGNASALGGVSTGFWGPRFALNITLT